MFSMQLIERRGLIFPDVQVLSFLGCPAQFHAQPTGGDGGGVDSK